VVDWNSTAKMYYDAGMWTKQDLATLVQKGKITAEQYEAIVGEPYNQ
jgi:uncharacterized XkdX family phage protein